MGNNIMLKFIVVALATAVSMKQAEDSLVEDEITVPEHMLEDAMLDENDPDLVQTETGEGDQRLIIYRRRRSYVVKRRTTVAPLLGTKYYWKQYSNGRVYRKKCTKGYLYGYYCQHHWHRYFGR